MSERDAAADLKICDAATAGPWETRQGAYTKIDDWSAWIKGSNGDGRNRIACWIKTRQDAEFIALAREALPYWIAESQRLAARVAGEGVER